MARNNTLPLDKRFPRQSTHFIEASQEMNPLCSSFSTPEVQACLSLGVAKFGTHWADKSSPSGAWVESNESVSHLPTASPSMHADYGVDYQGECVRASPGGPTNKCEERANGFGERRCGEN